MRVVLVTLVLVVGGCRCRPARDEAKPAHATSAWPAHTVADVPPDVYGVPAWSKVFALLFERRLSVGVPGCSLDGGCLGAEPLQLRGEPMRSRELVLGSDEPQAFIGEQVGFLEEPARLAALERAIDAAMTIDPATAPVAAVLFQSDLWERVDSLTAQMRTEPGANWSTLERLRAKLLALMRQTSLPAAMVAGLGANEAALERRFPVLLAGFGARDGWVEVRGSTSGHASAPVASTRHAERHGYRYVFRVFVRHPGGTNAARLAVERPAEPFPEGTRFVITGSPLVVTREGGIVAAPFITLLETRVAAAQGSTPGAVGAISADVFEGSRARLVRALDDFVLLPRDALIPVGATCMPDFTTRVPLTSTCVSCHGPTLARLNGSVGQNDTRFWLEADPGAAAEAVRALKQGAEEFRVLAW